MIILYESHELAANFTRGQKSILNRYLGKDMAPEDLLTALSKVAPIVISGVKDDAILIRPLEA